MTDTHVRALLGAAKEAGVVLQTYPYQPKDVRALPCLAAGDRAGSVGVADEGAALLSRTAAVTFYLVTDAKGGFEGNDTALGGLQPVYEAAGWGYVRDRQVEATWGDRSVIVCQLFLSRATAANPVSGAAPSSTFIPEPGL